MLDFFTFSLAYMGIMRIESRMRMLQLVLLFSVTFLTTGYLASISTNEVSIDYPKVYDTYESLTSLRTCLIMDPMSIKFFKGTKFRNTQVERHMQQSMSQYIYTSMMPCKMMLQEYEKKSLVFIVKNYGITARICFRVNLCINLTPTKNGLIRGKVPQFIRKSDPEALEIMTQIPVSSSIGNIENHAFHSTAVIIFEMGFYQGSRRYESLIQYRDFHKIIALSKSNISAKMDDGCVSDVLEPEIETFHQLHLIEMKKLLLLSLVLLSLGLLLLFIERIILSRAKSLPT